MIRQLSLIAAILLTPALQANPGSKVEKSAKEEPEKAEINKLAPNFTLKDQSGKSHSLSDYKGKIVVLEWWNKDCPFVVKHYATRNMQTLQKNYTDKGIVWLTIVSSAPGKQGHLKPEEIQKVIKEQGSSQTAVLIDEKGVVARAYNAQRTPHMYIINQDRNLVYIGAIDDQPSARQDTIKNARNYVAQGLDQLLSNKEIAVATTEAYGCTLKL